MAELYEKEKVYFIHEVVRGSQTVMYVGHGMVMTDKFLLARFFDDFEEACTCGKALKSITENNYVVFSAFIEVNGFDIGHLVMEEVK